MPNWTDILKEVEAYKDDVEIGVAEAKLTLGDLRKLVRSQTESIDARTRDVSQREQDVANLYAELQDIAKQKVAGQDATAISEANQAIDYEHDALFGPLDSRIKDSKKAADEARAFAEQVRNSTSAALAAVYEDLWASEWQRRQWPAEKLDAAKKYALQNRIQNRMGVIDPIRAFDEMTRDERINVRIAKEREDAEKKGYDRARSEVGASILPFSTATPGTSPAPKIDPKKTIAENIRANLQEVFGRSGGAARE